MVNQKLACKILMNQGHKVQVVDNGQLAVEAVQKRGFDVILMDVSMPVMGGIEATMAIREFEKSLGADQVPIVALTAHAMLAIREVFAGRHERVCLETDQEGRADQYVAFVVEPEEGAGGRA